MQRSFGNSVLKYPPGNQEPGTVSRRMGLREFNEAAAREEMEFCRGTGIILAPARSLYAQILLPESLDLASKKV